MKTNILIIIGMLVAVNLYSAFDDIGWTARSMALGNAMFGDFDGVNTMNYNPATISMARSIQFYSSWNTPYAGLNDQSMINVLDFNLVVPFWNKFSLSFDPFVTKRAAIGISVHRLSVGDGTMEFYHEGVYSFIYAKDLNDVLFRGAKISAGVKLAIYDIGVGNHPDVTLNPTLGGILNRTSFGLDLGITYDFSETIRLGLSYKNLIAPNISILPDGTDRLPSEFRLGANWAIGNLLFMKDTKLGFGLVSYGRDATDNRQSDASYNIGFEFKQLSAHELFKGKPFVGEMLTVRLGAIWQQKKIVEDVFNITGGIGFMYIFGKRHQLNLDYSLEFRVNNISFRHVVGLTYQLLMPNSAFMFKEVGTSEEVNKDNIELPLEGETAGTNTVEVNN